MNVGAWLQGLGLGQYEAAFRDNGVDASVLPELTAEDLKEMGVAAVGHRRKLLAAIAALKGPPMPGAAISRPSLSWSNRPPARTVLNLARRNVDHQLGGIAGALGLTCHPALHAPIARPHRECRSRAAWPSRGSL